MRAEFEKTQSPKAWSDDQDTDYNCIRSIMLSLVRVDVLFLSHRRQEIGGDRMRHQLNCAAYCALLALRDNRCAAAVISLRKMLAYFMRIHKETPGIRESYTKNDNSYDSGVHTIDEAEMLKIKRAKLAESFKKSRDRKKDWSSKFDNLIVTLHRRMSVDSSDDHISPIIKQINEHYNELLRMKKRAAKTCVMSITNVTWMSPAHSCVMWIGGILPSDTLKLIMNNIELSQQQHQKIEILKSINYPIQEEAKITNEVDSLKKDLSDTFSGKSFVDKGDQYAMSNYKNKMFEQIVWLFLWFWHGSFFDSSGFRGLLAF
ncbi:transcription factor TGA2.2-like [Rutidosis leptorrhynchoides]|uniref:transcription factor TGA2.2-like n=1 Tax=Rutidosis leptorrhynchoides TaxID=125765 RepID=UPI003A9A4FBC